jgi:hypothetical protein
MAKTNLIVSQRFLDRAKIVEFVLVIRARILPFPSPHHPCSEFCCSAKVFHAAVFAIEKRDLGRFKKHPRAISTRSKTN